MKDHKQQLGTKEEDDFGIVDLVIIWPIVSWQLRLKDPGCFEKLEVVISYLPVTV